MRSRELAADFPGVFLDAHAFDLDFCPGDIRRRRGPANAQNRAGFERLIHRQAQAANGAIHDPSGERIAFAAGILKDDLDGAFASRPGAAVAVAFRGR